MWVGQLACRWWSHIYCKPCSWASGTSQKECDFACSWRDQRWSDSYSCFLIWSDSLWTVCCLSLNASWWWLAIACVFSPEWMCQLWWRAQTPSCSWSSQLVCGLLTEEHCFVSSWQRASLPRPSADPKVAVDPSRSSKVGLIGRYLVALECFFLAWVVGTWAFSPSKHCIKCRWPFQAIRCLYLRGRIPHSRSSSQSCYWSS